MTELSIAQVNPHLPTSRAGKSKEQYYAEVKAKRTHSCLHCNKEYVSKRRHLTEGHKFCSRECYYAQKADRAKPVYSKVYFNTCVICSCRWVSKRKAVAVCSDECRKEQGRINYRAAFEAEVALRQDRLCRECNATYRPIHNAMEFCTEECSHKHTKRNGKAVRRARMRGADTELIDVVSIFNRDRWLCKCCGVKTPWTHRGTIKPTAPELDHIIPLSQGGTHTRANVQLLCRGCNGTKSNGTANDQLLMFG